jgi:hypothetical protein
MNEQRRLTMAVDVECQERARTKVDVKTEEFESATEASKFKDEMEEVMEFAERTGQHAGAEQPTHRAQSAEEERESGAKSSGSCFATEEEERQGKGRMDGLSLEKLGAEESDQNAAHVSAAKDSEPCMGALFFVGAAAIVAETGFVFSTQPRASNTCSQHGWGEQDGEFFKSFTSGHRSVAASHCVIAEGLAKSTRSSG